MTSSDIANRILDQTQHHLEIVVSATPSPRYCQVTARNARSGQSTTLFVDLNVLPGNLEVAVDAIANQLLTQLK